jgi:hypothetical protein
VRLSAFTSGATNKLGLIFLSLSMLLLSWLLGRRGLFGNPNFVQFCFRKNKPNQIVLGLFQLFFRFQLHAFHKGEDVGFEPVSNALSSFCGFPVYFLELFVKFFSRVMVDN